MLTRSRGDFRAYSEGLYHGQETPSGLSTRVSHKILELHRAGRSINALANEFQVARQTVMNWIRQEDANEGRRDDILTSTERTELTLLRRENKRLKLEQEILSKAAAWFAREADTIPKKSSDS